MRKLKLNPDALRVDTFIADEQAPGAGTVRGNMPFEFPLPDDPSEGGGSAPNTNYNSCYGTCYNTCTNTIPHTCQHTCYIDFCSDLCPSVVICP